MTLEKRFKKEFENGMEFWTSQDGTLMNVAICFTPEWPKRLKELVEARGTKNKFKPNRVKRRYVFREWAESEYFFFKGDKGKVWTLTDEATPFPVYDYELEFPH